MYRKKQAGVIALGLALLTALGLVAVACGDSGETSSAMDGKSVKVVTTLPLFADIIRQVGGDRVQVFALYPTGADPHTFEPSPKDIDRVSKAEVAIVNGKGLEAPALRVIEPNLGKNIPLLQLAAEALKRGFPGSDAAQSNPHVWLHLEGARTYADLVRHTLATVDPDGSPFFEANFLRYSQELDELDRYTREKIVSVPQDKRRLVTAHDAFPYLAEYLGFTVEEFVARNPGQEPSPRDIAGLTAALRNLRIPAVFGEPQLDAEGRILNQAAQDAGAEVCTLYSDSLDERVRSYIELMRFDVDEIARCLGSGN